MRKVTCLTLALFLLLSTVACGNSAPETETSAPDTAPVETEPAETELTADLPEVTFDGADFTSLIRTEWAYEFVTEEDAADVVDDAVYRRNLAVEETYGVKLVYQDVAGSWGEQNTYINTLKNSITAGDSQFDMAASYQAYMVPLAMEGLFWNIMDMDHIDTSKPWWSAEAAKSLTLFDCLYLATGDITLTMWENLYVMFYNKQMAADYGVPDLNQLVLDGEWTIERQMEIARQVSSDTDGDGAYTDKDTYGYGTGGVNHWRAFVVTCDLPIAKVNGEGIPELTYFNEKTITALALFNDLIWGDNSTYAKFTALNEPIAEGVPDMFIGNQLLLVDAFLGQSATLRDMETDFGILPRPKYDTAQQDYKTTMHNAVSMICFPVVIADPEMSGIIAEALCFESYRILRPAFYEATLKDKLARDEVSGQMIDLIRDSVTCDFGWVHSLSLGSIGTLMQSLLEKKSTDFVSEYQKVEKSLAEQMEAVIEAYQQNLES